MHYLHDVKEQGAFHLRKAPCLLILLFLPVNNRRQRLCQLRGIFKLLNHTPPIRFFLYFYFALGIFRPQEDGVHFPLGSNDAPDFPMTFINITRIKKFPAYNLNLSGDLILIVAIFVSRFTRYKMSSAALSVFQ